MFSLLDQEKLKTFLKAKKIEAYRFGQINRALYQDLVSEIAEITTLPADLRALIKDNFFIHALTKIQSQSDKNAQSEKVVFQTETSEKIEAVLLKHLTGRITVCVSTQVGCPNRCLFCATGQMGFKRNLEFYEIVEQVLHFARQLKQTGQQVRNVVLMGMGEPLLNYPNVKKALQIINDQKCLGIGARHLTLSTCGIIPQILELARDFPQVNLAISLHAPNDALRTKLMPINLTYSLKELMQTLDQYVKITNKRIFYEYILLKDVTDTPELAQQLGQLLKVRLAHVNLIRYNQTDGITKLAPSSQKNILKFQSILEQYGVPSTVRMSLGEEIQAACGQLAGKNKFSITNH
ncbi:23S rRNA (adenine(2503)-C(2))-methyltransferase RlmN [Candidatus Peregrinibacteria bacterium CG08_land_8_20_14_0_20_41_10]|nr:MAG: 23S rRNA (adenine(2503)-C(2))-methyltransferase [Candidatus Peregrinibacteria bacterium CG1_02_41_10]PIS32195.1 MAG: 23S rRNA (adenine(2503)-C(2))-methyltransferase RlmN [Candidatus Peregrinibacteria bacterium CG08_land_8_20_14_0_20_41_10]